ncbi:MAG: putative ATPase, AAA family [Streblomastix strix]|uniref:Putative ATPase, AAA family n=2 Tax=Streblomastix strix TaxID=222440 RepID=A0A5J4UXS0_9EUKA|nr:MAG: putative ATPase, AAA family [Streblomastix strix]
MQGEVIDKVYWDDIVGLDAVKKVLRDDIEHKRYQNLHAFGPIGGGKTLIGRAFVCEGHVSYISITPAMIAGDHDADYVTNIRAAFDKARQIAPCVLFIDEIDQLIADTQSLLSRMIISEIDQQVQGIRPEISGVMVIVASNDPDKLPQSIIRRFHHHMYFGVPNDNERATFFQKFLQKQAIYFQNSEIQQLVQATAGGRYSYSDLSHITDAFFNEDRSRININQAEQSRNNETKEKEGSNKIKQETDEEIALRLLKQIEEDDDEQIAQQQGSQMEKDEDKEKLLKKDKENKKKEKIVKEEDNNDLEFEEDVFNDPEFIEELLRQNQSNDENDNKNTSSNKRNEKMDEENKALIESIRKANEEKGKDKDKDKDNKKDMDKDNKK